MAVEELAMPVQPEIQNDVVKRVKANTRPMPRLERAEFNVKSSLS